jgi:hypothetical protein
MTLREYVVGLIVNDPALSTAGFTLDAVFTQHSVDTPQVRPFMVLRWQAAITGFTTTAGGNSFSKFPINQRVLQVWVHDKPADYALIDWSLKRLRAILTNVEAVNVGAPDEWLHTIVWEGESDDLSDDEARTITRNAQFRLTGSAI